MAEDEKNSKNQPEQRSEDAQNLDDLTSLQREPASLDRGARDDVHAEREGEGAPDDPSLLQLGQDEKAIRRAGPDGGAFVQNPAISIDIPAPPSGVPQVNLPAPDSRGAVPLLDSVAFAGAPRQTGEEHPHAHEEHRSLDNWEAEGGPV